MRIEELVLEGFKSYPERTQITGWDPSFNAITGLNGSGKSNILDAIAFVLGLTNMSTMRAQHQADLVYKKGQAGITKASVTIVFDNSEREKSPVGYEDWGQITVTRQFALPNTSKYLINGHKSQQQAVQSLFQSVQLNINNPNFVIMQGKITKVLNMRAPEILGMVEEAAGTRMFEERKDKARKTMTKKDKRVDEITSMLTEEIIPKLDRLREEKRSYLEFQKAETEKEKIENVLNAWKWKEADDRIKNGAREIEDHKQEIEVKKREKKEALASINVAEKDVERVMKERENEVKKGGKLSKLQDKVTNLDKDLVKLKTQAEIKEKDIKDEEGQVTSKAAIQELEATLTTKEKEVEQINKSYDVTKAKNTTMKEKLESDEELLQTLLTGLSSKDANSGGGGGYMGQLQAARARQSQAAAEEETTKVKVSMAEKELQDTEARWKKVEKDAGEGRKRLDTMQGVVEECKRKLTACGWNAEMEAEGESKIEGLRRQVETLVARRDAVSRNLNKMDFEYTTPGPHFDRRKVKGPLGKLVSIHPDNYEYATALEVTAGGKLYQVVISDEKVGKDLLDNGHLKNRVTFIPLSKIRPYRITPQKLEAVAKLAHGKARLALDLVQYDNEVSGAMAYTFGSTIVCDDPETAKRITFDRNLALRCVTKDGDVYEPSGTLSGGSKLNTEEILVKVQQLLKIEADLAAAKKNLNEAEAEWNNDKAKKKRDEWSRLGRELQMKEHELHLVQDQLGESNATRLKNQVEALREQIQTLKEDLAAAQKKQKEAADECKKLERDMAEFKNNKDGKIDELRKSISSQKAALQKHNTALKSEHKEAQTANLELEAQRGELEAAQLHMEEEKAAIEKLRGELAKLTKDVARQEAEYETARRDLEREMQSLKQFDEEIRLLQETIKEKRVAVEEAEEDVTRLQHAIEACKKAMEHGRSEKDKLEKMFEFIAAENDSFGKPGTKYHFASMNIQELHKQATGLEETIRTKKKKVNAKSANMLDDVEKREISLKKMLSTVVKDKEKIEQTIDELDREKRDTLQSTFEKVDRDFGQIFAELLPGNFAKLQPPDGMDLMDGLEVKVRLGSVWKQSLTELSGGQRSLIALSLIMALLQFKPAPMYILDEIDAALDLQHTQNIGHLFRTRFKGSQFIVVSLKEGLFTNANVLFRTRFRDGTSIVERTANRSSSTLYEGGGNTSAVGGGRGRRR